jgi:hypothetical protein
VTGGGLFRLVDPHCGRQLWRDGWLADEPLRVACVRLVEDDGALVVEVLRPWWKAAGVISPIPEWRWAWLYQSTNARQWVRAWSMSSNRAGNSGRHIKRIPRKNTYTLTPDGIRVAVFHTKLRNRLLMPVLEADKPPAKTEIRQALRTLENAVTDYIQSARLVPAK